MRLDVLARDSDGQIYNIEIQRKYELGMEKRVRYYHSTIDSNALKKGEEYQNLPENYVIFIIERDCYGGEYRIYHIDPYIKELKIPFNDGSHTLLVDVSETKGKATVILNSKRY